MAGFHVTTLVQGSWWDSCAVRTYMDLSLPKAQVLGTFAFMGQEHETNMWV